MLKFSHLQASRGDMMPLLRHDRQMQPSSCRKPSEMRAAFSMIVSTTPYMGKVGARATKGCKFFCGTSLLRGCTTYLLALRVEQGEQDGVAGVIRA